MTQSNEVTETWVDRTAPSLLEQRVLTEAFWEMLAGRAVPINRLSSSLELGSGAVDEVLGALETAHQLRRDESGAVVAARGLMIAPSAHQLETACGTTYTQCAVDAIGIPAALGVDAAIHDRCAYCGSPVEVTVSRDGDVTVQPVDVAVAMARAESWNEDGIPTVCRETNLFCSRDHVDAWQRDRATLPGTIISPAEAATVGRGIWRQFAQGEERS